LPCAETVYTDLADSEKVKELEENADFLVHEHVKRLLGEGALVLLNKTTSSSLTVRSTPQRIGMARFSGME
jgi:hypothetical protein